MKKHNRNEMKWFLIYSIFVTCIVGIIYNEKMLIYIFPKLRLYAYLSIVILTTFLIFEVLKIILYDFRVIYINKIILIYILLSVSMLIKLNTPDIFSIKSKDFKLLEQKIDISNVVYKKQSLNVSMIVKD